MTPNNLRPKNLKIVVIVLALLLASGNLLLSKRGTSAQGIDLPASISRSIPG